MVEDKYVKEHAIGFANWLLKNDFKSTRVNTWTNGINNYTTEQAYNKYLETL